jgi:Ni/Co efflux regulator RcnB
MFLATQFDNDINCNYTMSAANQKKFQKSWGQGDRIIKKQREKQMSNKDYAKYIFWIVLTAILLSTLSGS